MIHSLMGTNNDRLLGLFAISCPSVNLSISSVGRRLLVALPLILALQSRLYEVSVMIKSKNMLNRVDYRITVLHPTVF